MIALLAVSFLFSKGVSAPVLPKERLQAAAAFSASHGGHAFLVIQNGKTLLESYANGHAPAEPHRIYSGTKAFWCLTAFAAEKEGLLDLDEPVSKTIREWRGDAKREALTVRQLLTFSSGVAPMFGLHENSYGDRTTAALKAPVSGKSGRAFIYGPAALQVYHEVLARKLKERGMTPMRYLERRVLGQVSLGAQRYLPDQRGVPLLASGFMQTARQWSRLGTLVLKRQDLLDTLEGGEANAAYGYGFWNNHAAEHKHAREVDVESMLDKPWEKQSWQHACLCRSAPADMLACIGSYGQRLFIVPSLKLVVVRLAKDKKPDDVQLLRLLFPSGDQTLQKGD